MPIHFLQDSNVTTPTESNVLIHVFIDDLLEITIQKYRTQRSILVVFKNRNV